MVMAEQLVVRIGNYDVIRTIGKGNFASVKLARHRVTKTEVSFGDGVFVRLRKSSA